MNQIATRDKPSLLKTFGERYEIEPANVMSVLKKTAFSTVRDITNEQMISLLAVANEYNLNPFTKEIYAFSNGEGIVPIVGVDGWITMINRQAQFDGVEFRTSDTTVEVGGVTCCEWMEAVIYRKDLTHPIIVREYFKEVFRNKNNWKQQPMRMLRHRALIQCARVAFGFSGIYDPDEGRNIIEATAKPQSNGTKVYETKADALSDALDGVVFDEDTGEIANE